MRKLAPKWILFRTRASPDLETVVGCAALYDCLSTHQFLVTRCTFTKQRFLTNVTGSGRHSWYKSSFCGHYPQSNGPHDYLSMISNQLPWPQAMHILLAAVWLPRSWSKRNKRSPLVAHLFAAPSLYANQTHGYQYPCKGSFRPP